MLRKIFYLGENRYENFPTSAGVFQGKIFRGKITAKISGKIPAKISGKIPRLKLPAKRSAILTAILRLNP